MRVILSNDLYKMSEQIYTSGRGPGVTELCAADLDEGCRRTRPPPLVYVLRTGF